MEIWQIVGIYVVLSLGVRLVIKAYKADKPAQQSNPRPQAWGQDSSSVNKTALLADPAKMIERSLVFMAALDNRPKLYGISNVIVTDFINLNTEPVQNTGKFANKAFELDNIGAEAFRQLLLGSLLNNKYRTHTYSDAPDTTIANICYGLAILSQNTTLDAEEVAAWRLLLLSKAKEVYPTYDSAYAVLKLYYENLHRVFSDTSKIRPNPDLKAEYRRAQEKRVQDAAQKAARLEKQLIGFRKLNADPDWRRHMGQSWEKFQPMTFDEITKIQRSPT